MGHAASQLADDLHLLRLDQLPFDDGPVRDVDADSTDPDVPAVRSDHGKAYDHQRTIADARQVADDFEGLRFA